MTKMSLIGGVVVALAIIIAIQVLSVDRWAFELGCSRGFGSVTIESKIFCKRLSWNNALPWKPDLEFNGKRYIWLSSAGLWLTEEQYLEWKDK